MEYRGKKVLVTGGASGIGRELALTYARLGATVLVADRDYQGTRFVEEELQSLVKACAFYHVELAGIKGCRDLMESIFRRYEDLDILINNAASTSFTNLLETTPEDWDYVMGTNLRAPFLLAQAFAQHRERRGFKDRYGRIINIASSRWQMSEEGTEAYTASKGGLVSLTHGLAISLSGFNITVNSISPGWICCDPKGYEQLSYSDHRQHPSGRVGTPADVARACLFLTDEANDFVNGENLVVDGGMTKKMIYLD